MASCGDCCICIGWTARPSARRTRCAITLRNAVAEQSAPAAADEVEIIGPAPAYIRRLRDRARWHVLLRGPSHRLAELVSHVPRGWTIDTDPTTLL